MLCAVSLNACVMSWGLISRLRSMPGSLARLAETACLTNRYLWEYCPILLGNYSHTIKAETTMKRLLRPWALATVLTALLSSGCATYTTPGAGMNLEDLARADTDI